MDATIWMLHYCACWWCIVIFHIICCADHFNSCWHAIMHTILCKKLNRQIFKCFLFQWQLFFVPIMIIKYWWHQDGWKYFLLAGLNVEGCTYASMSLLLVYRLTKCSNMAMNYESMTLKFMNNWHLKYADPVECDDPKKTDKLITKLDCNILAQPRIYIIFLTVFLYICR